MSAPDKAAKHPQRRTFELSLKFGGISVTIKGLGGVVTLLAIALVAAAVGQELRLPAARRTWHGRVFRYVPYDFRLPTLGQLRSAYWDPRNPHLFTDKPLGVGWSINLARLRSAIKS